MTSLNAPHRGGLRFDARIDRLCEALAAGATREEAGRAAFVSGAQARIWAAHPDVRARVAALAAARDDQPPAKD